MPWSEWQDPFIYQMGPSLAFLTFQDQDGKFTSWVEAIQNPWAGGQAVNESRRVNSGQVTTTALQYTANQYWDIYRPKYPPTLGSLTEGVDYDIIPGRDASSDDAFVDWSPDGVNQHQGWQDVGGIPHILHASGEGSTATAAWKTTASAFLGGGGYPEEPGTQNIGPRPQSPYAAWAVQVAQGVGGTSGTEGDIGDFPAWQISGELSFTLNVQAIAEYLGGDPNETASGSGWLEIFQIVQRVLMPQWRYWVPDRAIPLRQRQRDDGLGLSTSRWRQGRSRQVSNRWKGYL